jgi:nucleotide-binding universal stress UspA family protein
MNKREKIVLVPVDFTKEAEVAMDHAFGFAKLKSWSVMLLHVINAETKSKLKKEAKDIEDINKDLALIAEKAKETHGIEVDFMTQEGSIFNEISSVCEEIKARIVFMGTHGKVGIQKFIGSYALKVITSSKVPFIVVQDKAFGEGYKNLVIPIDDSPYSSQKASWAMYIAKIFNSKLHFVVAYNSIIAIKARVNAMVSRIERFLVENNIQYEIIQAEKGGSFPKQIIDYYKSISADMITIMTEKQTAIPGFMFTKWQESILFNEEKMPVMCINPVEVNFVFI